MTQGKPFIRPEDAQSMLREATPGPWQARGDGPSAGHPHFYICTCEDRAHVAENVYYRNARLLTYAPDLAEVVANLRYEYAVQVKGGWWVGENDAGELVPTTDPMRALRHYHPDVASRLAAEAGKQLGHECCVASRLATDWEVEE